MLHLRVILLLSFCLGSWAVTVAADVKIVLPVSTGADEVSFYFNHHELLLTQLDDTRQTMMTLLELERSGSKDITQAAHAVAAARSDHERKLRQIQYLETRVDVVHEFALQLIRLMKDQDHFLERMKKKRAEHNEFINSSAVQGLRALISMAKAIAESPATETDEGFETDRHFLWDQAMTVILANILAAPTDDDRVKVMSRQVRHELTSGLVKLRSELVYLAGRLDEIPGS